MLGESITYNDIVTYLTNGVTAYCKNVNTFRLPAYVSASWGGNSIEVSRGSKHGNKGRLYDSCYFTVTLSSGGVSTINKESSNASEVTVKSTAEKYMKFVNNTLSAQITDAKVQAVYQAIISFCNDNIQVISAACPFGESIGRFSYCNEPVFIVCETPEITSLNTSIQIKAADMIKSLGDFSTVMRKEAHPKLRNVTYTLKSYKRNP